MTATTTKQTNFTPNAMKDYIKRLNDIVDNNIIELPFRFKELCDTLNAVYSTYYETYNEYIRMIDLCKRLEEELKNRPTKIKLVVQAVTDKKFIEDVKYAFELRDYAVKENEVLSEYVDELKEKVSHMEEMEALLSYSDSLMREKDELIMTQRNQIDSLTHQLTEVRTRFDRYLQTDSSEAIITYGSEQDLYEGEHKDIVLEVLEESMKSYDPFSRRYAVLKSIVEGNEECGVRRSLKRRISELFKGYLGYNKLTHTQKTELSDIGFEIEYSGDDHPKLIFKGHGRFKVTIPGTPGKTNRSGQNTSANIIRKVL